MYDYPDSERGQGEGTHRNRSNCRGSRYQRSTGRDWDCLCILSSWHYIVRTELLLCFCSREEDSYLGRYYSEGGRYGCWRIPNNSRMFHCRRYSLCDTLSTNWDLICSTQCHRLHHKLNQWEGTKYSSVYRLHSLNIGCWRYQSTLGMFSYRAKSSG